jgi:nitrite reductase (NO-forming)
MTEVPQPSDQPIKRRDFLAGLGYTTAGVAVGVGMGLGIPKLGEAEETTRNFSPALDSTPDASAATPSGGAPPPPPAQAVDLPYLPAPEQAGPISRSTAETVEVKLTIQEVDGRLADGAGYNFWTFNGTVPGPMIRARQGDQVELTLENPADSHVGHNIDLHAVTGPGGGAVLTNVGIGETKTFGFKALHPGVYIYHCATAPIDLHISNGMYGLIVVEPEEGLPEVDHEFYVCQGEIYTPEAAGTPGMQSADLQRMLMEQPSYVVFNGAMGALVGDGALRANVGDRIRIFFGVGGPNLTSSFHVIGEIFDRAATMGSLTSLAENVQTVSVPPGAATMVEFEVQVPGTYLLVDHALSRLRKGAAGHLVVDGPENPDLYRAL